MDLQLKISTLGALQKLKNLIQIPSKESNKANTLQTWTSLINTCDLIFEFSVSKRRPSGWPNVSPPPGRPDFSHSLMILLRAAPRNTPTALACLSCERFPVCFGYLFWFKWLVYNMLYSIVEVFFDSCLKPAAGLQKVQLMKRPFASAESANDYHWRSHPRKTTSIGWEVVSRNSSLTHTFTSISWSQQLNHPHNKKIKCVKLGAFGRSFGASVKNGFSMLQAKYPNLGSFSQAAAIRQRPTLLQFPAGRPSARASDLHPSGSSNESLVDTAALFPTLEVEDREKIANGEKVLFGNWSSELQMFVCLEVVWFWILQMVLLLITSGRVQRWQCSWLGFRMILFTRPLGEHTLNTPFPGD